MFLRQPAKDPFSTNRLDTLRILVVPGCLASIKTCKFYQIWMPVLFPYSSAPDSYGTRPSIFTLNGRQVSHELTETACIVWGFCLGVIRMTISEEPVTNETMIEKLEGRFDQSARQEYKWRVDLALNAGYRFIIIDMTDVSFIDSLALGWLVLSQRRFQRIKGQISIVVRDGFVRDILELTEISEWIPVFMTRDDAIGAVMKVCEPAAQG